MTTEDISKVQALGFSITFGDSTLVDFLNEYFPGLHLLQYLTEIDSLLKPLALTHINKELAFFEAAPQMLMIQYYSDDGEDEQYGLGLSRTFTRQKNELIAGHDFFRIPLLTRRKGIAKRLLGYSLRQYMLMGVDKIKIEATLENGGYVWAKALFTATEPAEVKIILREAEKKLPTHQFKFVKRVYDNYYGKHPDGKSFPMIKWGELPEWRLF